VLGLRGKAICSTVRGNTFLIVRTARLHQIQEGTHQDESIKFNTLRSPGVREAYNVIDRKL